MAGYRLVEDAHVSACGSFSWDRCDHVGSRRAPGIGLYLKRPDETDLPGGPWLRQGDRGACQDREAEPGFEMAVTAAVFSARSTSS